MMATSRLPGTVLRSDGLWPCTSADGLSTRRYSAASANAVPSSKATCSVRPSFDRRISVGQRFAFMLPPLHTRAGSRIDARARALTFSLDPRILEDRIVTAPAANDIAPTAPTPLTDRFGRAVTYLRISVTDRCDFRCFYCMSEDMTFLPNHDLLTLEELDRICTAFVEKGVRKLRITGGEPLVR